MSKTCSNCNFKNNPDGAHFCGSCGSSLYPSNYRWSVVDMFGYTRVPTSELNRLREIERKYNASPWSRLVAWLKKIDMDYIWAVLGIVGIGGVGVGLAFLYSILVKGCSDENNAPQLQRIEENGKYGVGYDKGHMLVAAQYADISMDAIGDQWITSDSQGKKGLVYVCDSVVNTLSPEYSDVTRFSNGTAILNLAKNRQKLAYHGQYLDDKVYQRISSPGNLGRAFVLENNKSETELYVLSKGKTNGMKYSSSWEWADGALLMRASSRSDLYTYDGLPIVTGMYLAPGIADSMVWAWKTRQDLIQNRPTLYNTYGDFIKYYPKGTSYVSFSDGIGWIRNSAEKYKWIAIDRKGNELFTFYGEYVDKFDNGLAPVFKMVSGRELMGMIDKKGVIVIPCKYIKSRYSKLTFDRDSTMSVKLDGVEGRLHRNGTFTPD